jgi:hypothetical protein
LNDSIIKYINPFKNYRYCKEFFMRYLFGLVALVAAFSSQAQVLGNPYTSACQYSSQSDSFGLGVHSVFTGFTFRPQYNDEHCYQLGRQLALDTLQNENTNCKAEHAKGLKQGLLASALGSGPHCYNLGYVSGIAILGTGARLGDANWAGANCIASYKHGRRDAQGHRMQNPGTTKQPELYCYQLGHFEAPLFK